MEHRCTERYSSDLNVLILKHKLPVATGRVKNGGRIGVFIETDFADIECEHQLTLEFLLEADTSCKIQQIDMRAIVIHKARNGFGAELEFSDQEQGELFLKMLRTPKLYRQTSSILAMAVNH